MNVTRAVLPVMRAQRSGHVVTISSWSPWSTRCPPLRWVAGADAVAAVERKANELLAQVDAYRELSSSLAV